MKISLRFLVLDYFLIQQHCNMTGPLANPGMFLAQGQTNHCSCCQDSGWEHEGDTESLLPARDCHGAVLLPSAPGMEGSAPVQEATCVHCRPGPQGMMLWGPVSLPEPEVLVDCLQPP